jgi:hypothetical protein
MAGITYEVTGPWRERPDATIRPKGGQVEIRPQPLEVKLDAPRTIRRRRLKERGLPVAVTLDTRSSVAVELRARNANGRRVVLAKAAADDAKPPRVRFRLEPRRGVQKLKRVTLVATVTEDVGRTATARRRIPLRGE